MLSRIIGPKHIHRAWFTLSKEVWKLNFRQYGEMERAQPGRNSDVEKVRREKLAREESQKGEGKRWRKLEERRCRCAKR